MIVFVPAASTFVRVYALFSPNVVCANASVSVARAASPAPAPTETNPAKAATDRALRATPPRNVLYS